MLARVSGRKSFLAYTLKYYPARMTLCALMFIDLGAGVGGNAKLRERAAGR